MSDVARIRSQLETAFRQIQQQRMADVPVINAQLEVAAIGFEPWQDVYLGILITPWFMNLMLLPQQPAQWQALEELSKQTWVFPSGQYRFIVGYEEAIGQYQSCSLFSPMFEFADQDAARETAEVALKELFNADNIETPDIDSEQISNIWQGIEQKPDNEQKPDDVAAQAASLSDEARQQILEQPTLDEKLQQPISRRELLRGALFGEDKAT